MSTYSVGCLKKPLGDVANVISGYAFKSSEFGEQGTPVIKIKNIRVGFIDGGWTRRATHSRFASVLTQSTRWKSNRQR